MNTGKKTLLALSVLALLSGATGANAATLEIKDNDKVEALKSDTDWAKHDGEKHWIYSQHEAMGNTIIVGEENGSGDLNVPYSIYGGVSMDALSQIATDAANNTITVHDGTTGNITGGQVNAGSFNAAKNKIDINGGEINGTVSGGIIGAEVVGGSAIENTVSISGGTVSGNITGGNIVSRSGDVSAKGNKVNISGDTTSISGDVYGANISEKGNVENNQVTISSGTFNKANAVIAGGYKYFFREESSGDIKENSVTITGGTFTGETTIYGGYIRKGGTDDITNNGSVIGNQVTISDISDGNQIGGIYGGWNKNGETKENVVTLTDSTLSTSRIYGGYSETGAVTGNQVKAEGTSVKGTIYGGYSVDGAVKGNQVKAEGNSSVGGTIYGGYSVVDGAVTGNQVIVEGTSSVEGDIYGGYGRDGMVTGNQVTINGESIVGNIYGGQSSSGNVTGNTVVLNGGKVTGTVFGGSSSTGTVSENCVKIMGDIDLTEAGIYAGYGNDTQQNGIVFSANGGGVDHTVEVKSLWGLNNEGYIGFEDLKKDGTFTVDGMTHEETTDGTTVTKANIWLGDVKPIIKLSSFDVSENDLSTGEFTSTISLNTMRLVASDEMQSGDANGALKKRIDTSNLKKDHVKITDEGVYAYQFWVCQVFCVNFLGSETH